MHLHFSLKQIGEKIRNYEKCVACHRSGDKDETVGKRKDTERAAETKDREEDED